jgi:hypothetical protein
VSAAGAIVGEQALQLATVVKTTQNALLGVVAVALTAYFTLRVERSALSARPRARELWERFPKFVLGFLAASIIATIFTSAVGSADAKPDTTIVNDLRTLFLILGSSRSDWTSALLPRPLAEPEDALGSRVRGRANRRAARRAQGWYGYAAEAAAVLAGRLRSTARATPSL